MCSTHETKASHKTTKLAIIAISLTQNGAKCFQPWLKKISLVIKSISDVKGRLLNQFEPPYLGEMLSK
jgi:hypothetical protein